MPADASESPDTSQDTVRDNSGVAKDGMHHSKSYPTLNVHQDLPDLQPATQMAHDNSVEKAKRPYKKRPRGEQPRRQSSRLKDSEKAEQKVSRLPKLDPKLDPKLAKLAKLEPDLALAPSLFNDPVDGNDENDTHGVIRRGSARVFVEPSVAEPQAVYTGFPLEVPPPARTVKSGRGGRKVALGRPATPDSDLEERQRYYRSQLAREAQPEPSSLRIKFKPLLPPEPKKRRKRPHSKLETPRQRGRGSADTPALEGRRLIRGSKRIKVISPKKHAATNLAPSSNGTITAAASDTEQTGENDDFCTTCGGSGVFICCDSCPKSFHFLCCDPPIEECPEDNWNCRECTAKNNPRPTFNYLGLFGQLVNHIVNKDPAEYQLPKRLRESFVGVATNDDGSYRDDRFKPEMSFSKRNGAQLPGFNRDENLEVDSLYDKDGHPLLCYRCKESGLPKSPNGWRTMACCDYCGTHWHLDCLDEPMCVAKTMGTKWMCPNHADQLLPNYVSTRKFKDASVVDASMHNHFVKIATYNSFHIKYRDQLYISDDMKGSVALQDYLRCEAGDASGQDNPNTQDGDVHQDFRIPDHLQTYAGAGGIYAKSGKRLKKVLTLTNDDAEGHMGSFVYRVPEELILLDFFTKVNRTKKADVLRNLQPYEDMRRLETNEHERDGVHGLIDFQKNDREKDRAIDFAELVEVASRQLQAECVKKDQPLTPEEISDLVNIKRLMQMTGRSQLMEFLQMRPEENQRANWLTAEKMKEDEASSELKR